ncbi:hypothetical protein [Nitrosomonas eutropha]|uniref:hypothetical protein n=1 Tax=Nitrosomonas eutropha TaxID=916 RepID=UPI00140F8F52|nr:hypothetical protein [Nitrosomonas eutropha]
MSDSDSKQIVLGANAFTALGSVRKGRTESEASGTGASRSEGAWNAVDFSGAIPWG